MTTTSHALRTRIVLSATTFTVLWEKLALGPLPRALFLPSPGATARERARIEHTAAIELAGLGIGFGTAADHELTAALRLLARPEMSCHGWVVPAAFGVHAAVSGRHAIVARLDAPVVELWPADPGDLAGAVVRQLPPLPPATGHAPLAGYSRVAFEQATGTTITGNGQFFVAVRDRLGRRRQGQAIEYLDTARGRWLVRRNPASAVPGTVAALTNELDAAAERLAAARRSHATHGL